MVPTLIKDLLSSSPDGQVVKVCGWVRTVRDSKNLVFIQVNDGSCFADIQLTFDRTSPSKNANVNNIEENLKKSGYKCSVEGAEKADWVLIDAYDVIVHIFRPEVREFYNLEKMWTSAANLRKE